MCYNPPALIYFLYPQLRKLSGAERLILKLADYVTREGAEVSLLTHRLDAACRHLVGPRVRVVETGETLARFRRHYLDAPLEYLASLRLLTHLGPEARALTFFGAPSLPGLFWSRAVQHRRIPHLYFCYEPPRFAYSDTREVAERLGPAGPLLRPFLGLYRSVDRRLAQSADILLGNSAFGACLLARAYGRPATVVTHGADLAAPEPGAVEALRDRLGLQGCAVLSTVNFLHPRKRIDLFLRTVSEVRRHVPQVVGLVVGSGPERGRLEALAADLGLGAAIRFTGFVPEAELPAYYALSDLYLHTGKLESFGLSVLEASAAGRPVIAVDEGGPREIIAEGETGFLVEAIPEALAAKTVALLQDSARRVALGQAGQARVRALYRWEDGARTFLGVIAGLVR